MHTNTRTFILIVSLALILALTGCNLPTTVTPQPTATSINLPPEQTATTPPNTEACLPLPSDWGQQISSALPNHEAVVVHQAFAGTNTLLIWLVDPALAAQTDEELVQEASAQISQVVQHISETDPCLNEIDALYFTIVDSSYWTWYSTSIQVSEGNNLSLDAEGGGGDESQGGGQLAAMPEPTPEFEAGDCDWQTANAALINSITTSENQAAFTFQRDAFGSHVFAYWQAADQAAAENSFPAVAAIADQLACLSPQPTALSVSIMLPDGQIILTGETPLHGETPLQESDYQYQILMP